LYKQSWKRCNIDLDTIKGIILRFKVDFMDAFSKSFITF